MTYGIYPDLDSLGLLTKSVATFFHLNLNAWLLTWSPSFIQFQQHPQLVYRHFNVAGCLLWGHLPLLYHHVRRNYAAGVEHWVISVQQLIALLYAHLWRVERFVQSDISGTVHSWVHAWLNRCGLCTMECLTHASIIFLFSWVQLCDLVN